MKYLSTKQILNQLKYDLIGKDSYRGVTLTYSWLANQFGHFSLGFMPTFIVYVILKKRVVVSHPAVWACVGVAGAWLLFELYNFLGPLLKKTSEYANKNASGGYTFRPDWKNIAYDTATDICFFWIGAFAVSIICEHNAVMQYILTGLVVLVLYPSYNWYTTKMYQQAANYPFQFRLSQWNCDIDDEKKSLITAFLHNTNIGNHLLLFGANKTGETSLGVALANEMSIKHKTCSYVTAIKLFSLFFEENEDLQTSKSLNLWSWRQASLIIIDDINPGLPVAGSVINCEEFYSFLNNRSLSEANKKALTKNSVIWVLGNNEPTDTKAEKWHQFLQQLGIEPSNNTSVNLSD